MAHQLTSNPHARLEVNDPPITADFLDRSYCYILRYNVKLGTSGRRVGAGVTATPVQSFWSQPMAPWTAIKKALPQCGGDTSSYAGPYPTAACPQCHIGCWLDRELALE